MRVFWQIVIIAAINFTVTMAVFLIADTLGVIHLQ